MTNDIGMGIFIGEGDIHVLRRVNKYSLNLFPNPTPVPKKNLSCIPRRGTIYGGLQVRVTRLDPSINKVNV